MLNEETGLVGNVEEANRHDSGASCFGLAGGAVLGSVFYALMAGTMHFSVPGKIVFGVASGLIFCAGMGCVLRGLYLSR